MMVDGHRASQLFKALSDPVRLELYVAIADRGEAIPVSDIPDVGVAQSTVSYHLRKLREAELIEGSRNGSWVHYRAVPSALDSVAEFIEARRSTKLTLLEADETA